MGGIFVFMIGIFLFLAIVGFTALILFAVAFNLFDIADQQSREKST